LRKQASDTETLKGYPDGHCARYGDGTDADDGLATEVHRTLQQRRLNVVERTDRKIGVISSCYFMMF